MSTTPKPLSPKLDNDLATIRKLVDAFKQASESGKESEKVKAVLDIKQAVKSVVVANLNWMPLASWHTQSKIQPSHFILTISEPSDGTTVYMTGFLDEALRPEQIMVLHGGIDDPVEQHNIIKLDPRDNSRVHTFCQIVGFQKPAANLN